AVGVDRAQELERPGAARARRRQDEAKPTRVAGNVAPIGDVLVAGDGEDAFAHVVLAHDSERALRLELPALKREHIELAVAQLAGIGENTLHVLARAGGGRAAIVELRELELARESRAEARLVGAGRAAGVDLARGRRGRDRGESSEEEGCGEGAEDGRHALQSPGPLAGLSSTPALDAALPIATW